jgi:Uma2 family endonuclease
MVMSMSETIAERLVTIEEWEALDEDDWRELVDGRLEEAEVPGLAHEIVVTEVVTAIRNWLENRGYVFASGAKYVVGRGRGRLPDASAYFTRQRLPSRSAVRRPPDIMIEVISQTPGDHRRDRVHKVQDYARFGVRFYWLIDPEARTLEILELRDGRYTVALTASEGVVDVPGCEGLKLDLDELWQRIDDLGDEP